MSYEPPKIRLFNSNTPIDWSTNPWDTDWNLRDLQRGQMIRVNGALCACSDLDVFLDETDFRNTRDPQHVDQWRFKDGEHVQIVLALFSLFSGVKTKISCSLDDGWKYCFRVGKGIGIGSGYNFAEVGPELIRTYADGTREGGPGRFFIRKLTVVCDGDVSPANKRKFVERLGGRFKSPRIIDISKGTKREVSKGSLHTLLQDTAHEEKVLGMVRKADKRLTEMRVRISTPYHPQPGNSEKARHSRLIAELQHKANLQALFVRSVKNGEVRRLEVPWTWYEEQGIDTPKDLYDETMSLARESSAK